MTEAIMVKITEDEFYGKFTLLDNHIDNNASFDGKMFETFGEELEFVKTQAGLNKVWTIIEGDEEELGDDGELRPNMYYVTGLHIVNRIGYLITNEAYTFDMEVKID